MEELFEKFNEVIEFSDNFNDEQTNEIEKFLDELESNIIEFKNSKLKSPSNKKAIAKNNLQRKSSTATNDDCENQNTTNIQETPNVSHISNESTNTSQSRPTRPGRTAKDKAAEHLKEAPLNSKMRREDVIKQERISIAANVSKIENNLNNIEKQNIQSNDDEPTTSTSRSSNSKKSKKDESILVVQENIETEVVLSDDDNDKMPPPISNCPPKSRTKKARTKKKTSVPKELIPETEIKQEKETEEITTKKPRTKKTKSKSSKKNTINSCDDNEVDIKPIVNEFGEIVKQDSGTLTQKSSQMTVIENSKNASRVANTTIESVYEDALTQNDQASVKDGLSQINKIPIQQAQTEMINNVTQVLSPREQNSTFVVGQSDANIVNDKTFNKSNNDKIETNSSIITEDASVITEDASSDEDIPLVKTKVMPKQPISASKLPIILKTKKEIFNPLIQSPVKKKVEAFEKHAQYAASPVVLQRVTRTKTKEKIENVPPTNEEPPSIIPRKPETPLGESRFNKINTPLLIGSNSKKLTGSQTKLNQKNLKSRENSVEDLRRAETAYAEEKRKKREEKQKQAQLTREAKEREKIELAEKVQREKEEKARKLMLEKTEKMRLEKEERARKKLIRDRQAIEEARKRQEYEKNLKLQKAREMLEIAKMKAQRNEIERSLQQNMYKKPEPPRRHINDFELLMSGDSTDEEEKVNKKKPPPPDWSRSHNRQKAILEASFANTKIVDTFFSVKPMTPNLRDIFPAIDERYLKRNSSAIWSTPPRYSELPKY